MMRQGHETRTDLYSKAKASSLATHQLHKDTATKLGWKDKQGNPDVGRVSEALNRWVVVPGGMRS
jgi:hypothetical protein